MLLYVGDGFHAGVVCGGHQARVVAWVAPLRAPRVHCTNLEHSWLEGRPLAVGAPAVVVHDVCERTSTFSGQVGWSGHRA